MKCCIPILNDRGWDSPVHGHFGSAAGFALVDTISGQIQIIANSDQQHEHGQCNPMKTLANSGAEAVAVIGIGPPAMIRLAQSGIRVFRCSGGSVRQTFETLKAGGLPEMLPAEACQHHGGGHSCESH